MDYNFVFHVFQTLHHLKTDVSQLIRLEHTLLPFVAFHELVQVVMQMLEYYYHMLTKFEAIKDFNHSIKSFGILTFNLLL